MYGLPLRDNPVSAEKAIRTRGFHPQLHPFYRGRGEKTASKAANCVLARGPDEWRAKHGVPNKKQRTHLGCAAEKG